MPEKQRSLNHFQNVALVATADTSLQDVEMEYLVRIGETLGLEPSDMVMAIDSLADVEFVIPEKEDERWEQLRDAVVIICSKGGHEVNQDEYEACVEFAENLGYAANDVDEMIEEFNKNMASINEEYNRNVYQSVFNEVELLGLSDVQLSGLIETYMKKHENTDFYSEKSKNKAIYKLLWLLLVRGVTLNEEQISYIPVRLDLMKAGKATFKDLQEDMLLLDSESLIDDIHSMPLDQIKGELSGFFKKVKG